MKKALFLLLVALGMLLNTACENEPHKVITYITTPEVQAKIYGGLAGTYSGKLIVVMEDTAKHVIKNEEGTWVKQAMRDSVPNYTYIVEGLNRQRITLEKFPFKWLSRVVSDAELREALKTCPDTPLTIDYELHGDPLAPNSHQGTLSYTTHPVSFDVVLAGTTHRVTVEFTNSLRSLIDADDPENWRIGSLQMEVSKVLVDGELIESFDDAWTKLPTPLFLIHLWGEKVE